MQLYCFRPDLARRHGVNGAVFLHAVAFWVAKNREAGRHFHQGRTWTYNTLEELTQRFPFWTRRQVEGVIARLKKEGALLTGHFSPDKTDRTVWYALTDPVLEVYGLGGTPTSPAGEMDFTPWGTPDHRTGNCNRETVPDQFQKTPCSPPEGTGRERVQGRGPKNEPTWRPEDFARFWDRYPRHEDRVSAVRAWNRLKLSEGEIGGIFKALDWQTGLEGWAAPYACRYLRNRRWTDEPPRARPAEEDWAPVKSSQPSKWHTEIINGEEVMFFDE